MADAKMKGTIQFRGQMFSPRGGTGDVRRLSAVASEEELKRWKDAGLIEGDWKSEKGSPLALVGGLDNTPAGIAASGQPRSGDSKLLAVEKQGAAASGATIVETKDGLPSGPANPAPESGDDSGAKTPLPDGFPARMQLMKAGFDTVEKVDKADDKDLIALPEVGEATVKKIREAIT
jgi:hypothetical protein